MAEGGVTWVAASNGDVPEGAFEGGYQGCDKAYVIRAVHHGFQVPGKVVPSEKIAYVSWGGREHAKENYEVLVVAPGSRVEWVRDILGTIPEGAIPAGSENGETIYIGRAEHEGCVVVGKVHPRYGKLYIPYGGQEVEFEEYEVLVKY